MKTGLTIKEMAQELLRQSKAKQDYLVNTGSLSLSVASDVPQLRVTEEGTDKIAPLDIRQTAHRQLGTYLGIPQKYYELMRADAPELLAYNANYWFSQKNELRTLRTIDGCARAFLSNRYRRIDNLDIASVTLPVIGELPEARFVSTQITDDFMYIKVVNPRLQADVVPGDVVQAGVIISNSETGLGSVTIQPLIYRLVCSNGMVLSCFRRCKYKLLTTGTSTRNNISEFAPQLELLYNNSINMISWCRTLYSYDKRSADMEHKENPYYGMPIPAYKKGYRLFANSHLPEKITVFGVGQRNQDIYNADELDRLLGKTVITRTFEEVTGKDIRRIHQMPIPFLPEEREVYNIVLKEFYRIQREYYSSTGNSRKDALMRLIQQITLLLRISAAPDCMKEYEGETPLKEMAVVEALARWPEEVVAIGVRHTTVLDCYAAAIREYLPERPLFVVTGSTVTFAKRRALREVLRDSQNGILLCTQQSLPSSVNFEFVNKIIIPEMHYNNAGMSQFYMRFVRYTSTEKKDLYFPIYIGSLESNLMQMVLAKEKLTMFMKGQDADMDEIYAKFGVDYDLLSTLMTRETDDEGHLRIHWGEQKIA